MSAEDRIRTCVGTKPIGVIVHRNFHCSAHLSLSRLATPAPPHKKLVYSVRIKRFLFLKFRRCLLRGGKSNYFKINKKSRITLLSSATRIFSALSSFQNRMKSRYPCSGCKSFFRISGSISCSSCRTSSPSNVFLSFKITSSRI